MLNNPAARLHQLALKLRSTTGDGPAVTLWAQVFDISLNNETIEDWRVEVTQKILAFWDVLNETQAGMSERGFEEFYLEAFPPLRRVVVTSLSDLLADQSNLTSPITDGTITLLRVIAAEWNNKKNETRKTVGTVGPLVGNSRTNGAA